LSKVIRLPDAARKFLALTVAAFAALSLIAAARAQTGRTRSTRAAQSKPSPSPTPIVVPRRPPQTSAQPRATPTPNQALVVPSQDDAAPPPPLQRPTPTPAPKAEEPEDEAEVVRVTSNLVVVPVAVTDASGNAIQGLKKDDFRLEEEGRAQELSAVGTAEEVPLDIAVLFDVSSSVTAKNFFALQREAAARFLSQVLKPSDRAAVITIADKPVLVQPLANAETATASVLKIPSAATSTPTAFYDSINFAAKYLDSNAPGNHRRVILAISDGDDNFSNSVREQTVAEYEAERKEEAAENGGRPLGERAAARRDLQARHVRAVAGVQRAVQGADAVFYSINPGGPSVRLNEISTRAQNGMQSVADATGGTAYVPARAEELETIFRQIAAELRAQYLLQYLSNNQAAVGKFLRIKVSTPARTDLRIRARQGYYKKGGK
jgi:Ca-activated chloride channel homolog